MKRLRRRLITILGIAAASVAFPLFAQQKRARIGLLMVRAKPAEFEKDIYAEIPRGLSKLGYVEGRNIEYLWRFGDGKQALLDSFARELVQLNVDVIVTSSAPATAAAKQATSNIPIVMGTGGDPVASGFVKSLSHPGGNITGLSNLSADLSFSSKWLELLRRAIPDISRLAVLRNPTNTVQLPLLANLTKIAQQFGISTVPLEARTPEEIRRSFDLIREARANALIVVIDPYFLQQSTLLAQLAADYRVPAIYGVRQHVEVGGLMSYGRDLGEDYRRAAHYVDKILKGAKPAELPVEQPTKLELAVNLKAAKALGITLRQDLLVQADVVVE